MPVRGTQSFLQILRECWHRPSLLALELLWRWLFGIPLLAVLVWQGWRIYSLIAGQLTSAGVQNFSLLDPMQATEIVSNAYAVLKPPILHLLAWLVPVALVVFAIISGIGRNEVLRRFDKTLPRRWGTLITLQLLRIVFLGGSFILWFAAIHWAAQATLWGNAPNLVGYFCLVIFFSLGIFVAWALGSWVFSIAPLIVLLENRGILSSLARSPRLGPLKGKLVEINLIMGIIKLALCVLAMAWSAMPLPFEAVVQGASLYAWWTLGSILYCIASDFFQVARVVAFLQLWRIFQPSERNPSQKFAASK